MDRLTLLETFSAALEEGSLNRAAQRRGVTQSAVSQQIKQLEKLTGKQLLHRTPRGVQATRAGDLVFTHARTLLEGYELMQAELANMSGSVAGTFRISCGNVLGRAVAGPMLIDLGKAYPDLNIVMKLEDRLVDVVREGFDLAIRAGKIGDTGGIGRRIASLDTVLFASPEYLDRMGRPEKPEDLKRLKLIQHHEDQTRGFIPLYRDGEEFQAPVRTGFTADDPSLILRAVQSAAGFTRAPRMIVEEELAGGLFEEVLPGFSPAEKAVYAVYPAPRGADRRMEVILEEFLARLDALHTASLARRQPLEAITA